MYIYIHTYTHTYTFTICYKIEIFLYGKATYLITCVVNVVEGKAGKRLKITEAEFSACSSLLLWIESPEYLPVTVTVLSENT